MIRARSLCDRKMLSYVGKNRTGAGRVGVRHRRVRDVEQLAAGLVPERPELRPEPLQHRAKPRPPAPGLDVRGSRRPERREVAEDHRVGRVVGPDRLPEPRLTRREHGPAALAPEPAGRNLDDRHAAPDRVAQRRRIAAGPAFREGLAQVVAAARPLVEESSPLGAAPRRGRRPRGSGRTGCPRKPCSWTTCRTGRSRSQSRAVTRWIVVRSIDGARTARLVSISIAQLLRLEAGEPRPERRVRVERLLRLHGDEVLDRLLGRRGTPLEQPLAGEQRPIQLASRQDGSASVARAIGGGILPRSVGRRVCQ